MNSHVQLNENGEFLRYIPSGILIEWDSNNYCTALALEKDNKTEEFRLKALYSTGKPEFNELTHRLKLADAKLINTVWTEQWKVLPLTDEEIANKLNQWRSTLFCHRRQGELALLQENKLDFIENAIESITDFTEKRKAQIEYRADVWERNNPFLQYMWSALGGTPVELDNLFILAKTL